jgi:hypothetical protein
MFILVFFDDFLGFFIVLFVEFLDVALVCLIGLVGFLIVFLSKSLCYFPELVNVCVL